MPEIADHALDCDLLVAGGGPAGFACALAAARGGARVVLCQDRPVLGGNASSEVRMHIVGATGLRDGLALQVENREGGIIEELRLDLAAQNPQRSPSLLDLLLYDKCRREPLIQLLLNTAVIAVEREGAAIRRVVAERVSTQDRFLISARIFADCTGDGRLGAEAGAAFMQGRESRAQYGETLAVDAADRKTLGSTLLFQAKRHDRSIPFQAPPWARKFRAEDFKLRPFAVGGSDLGLEYGYWWVEWGGVLDTIKDNERIRDELVAIVLGVWDFIKNESGVDASRWALDWIGFLPGKRESRRFVGQYVLREQDLFASTDFPDAIAFGGWPIDTHPPEGVDAPEEPPCTQHHLPLLYNIPLRATVAADIRNLMFAGRNISATHIAFASTRVMATCAVVGQGVGTAAALALQAGVDPADIAASSQLMNRIQRRLVRDGCFLVGHGNDDPADLARAARATASSAQAGGEPALVLDGHTRAVGSPAGAHPQDLTAGPTDRCPPGTHRWMSDPKAGLPAWLELRWAKPVPLRQIEITFDTAMHRHLTLTQAEGFGRRMIWGPQPETVRDYAISVETAPGQWEEVAKVGGNYQRRRVHEFSLATTSAVRIFVTATNGLDHARIFEVRAY